MESTVTTSLSDIATTSRRRVVDVPAIAATPQVATALQAVLVDLLELQTQAKQAHWNIEGAAFHGLHLQLDGVATTARAHADTVAERLRALGASPDGTSDTVVATTTLPALPTGVLGAASAAGQVVGRLNTAAGTLRSARAGVDEQDPVTADLLTAAVESLEKHAWMLRAGAPDANAS
jgi:starvation-inducible DNA-binding protein